MDRLTESLQHKLKLSEKLQTSCKVVAERRQEAVALQRELEPKLDVIVTKTKELQGQVCQVVGKCSKIFILILFLLLFRLFTLYYYSKIFLQPPNSLHDYL